MKGRDLVFFSPCVDRGSLVAETRDATVLVRTWAEAAAWLRDERGDDATVTVFPCANARPGALVYPRSRGVGVEATAGEPRGDDE